MTTDADRLAADGIPITLADGVHHLRFTMRALKLLEESFDDDIANVSAFLAGQTKARFGPLVDILAAGLVDEGLTADAVLDLAEPQRYTEYLKAAIDALDIAFPSPSEESADRPKDPAANVSTGERSTTSPPSSSAAAMATSGT